MRFLLVLSVLVILPAGAPAADIGPIAPYVDRQTLAIAYLDLGQDDQNGGGR